MMIMLVIISQNREKRGKIRVEKSGHSAHVCSIVERDSRSTMDDKPCRKKRKRQVSWLGRIPSMLETLKKTTTPFLDRAALQSLFHLRRRQASYLMKKLGPAELRIGRAYLVRRHNVVTLLEAKKKSKPYKAEELRQRTLRDALDEARREQKARSVRFKITPEPPRTMAGLPNQVRLAPGELRVNFATTEELLQLLYDLSRAIAHDFPTFEALSQAGRSDSSR